MPGPGAIYLSQSLRFRRPVRIGDLVVARATVKSLDAARGHVTLETVCEVGGKTVVDGEALVIAPRRTACARAGGSRRARTHAEAVRCPPVARKRAALAPRKAGSVRRPISRLVATLYKKIWFARPAAA